MREHIHIMLAGQGTLRFIVQPALAIIVGFLHGLRDARRGEPPYLVSLVTLPSEAGARLRQGINAIALPLTLAVAASVLFQYVVRSHVRLGYAILYAGLFVALPYAAVRSLANRLSRFRHRHDSRATPPRPAT